MEEYEWVRPREITFHQFLWLCQTHAECFIAGDACCYVLDDSNGEVTATRKGNEIVMIGGLYDVGGEWSNWYDLTSIEYDDNREVLGARLAGAYAKLIYGYSASFRHLCLPVSCKTTQTKEDDEVSAEARPTGFAQEVDAGQAPKLRKEVD